jgi:hypothetical protein
MGNVTDFLARVGQDSSLRHGSPAAREALLAAMGIEDNALRHALLGDDAEALRGLLGGARFIASQMPDGPEREKKDPDEGDDEGEGDDDGGGDGKPDRKTPRPPARRMDP